LKLTELQAITPEQLLRMNKTQLQSAVKELNKHVNRRMKKLERAGIEQQSPAYRSIQKVQEKMKEYVQEHPKTNWYHVFQAGKRELDRLYDELEQRERQIINELFESEAELVE